MSTPFRGTKPNTNGLWGEWILSIIDRLSASLLRWREGGICHSFARNETLSKGERVKGHQFYWCDYYLYDSWSGKRNDPKPSKTKTDLTEALQDEPQEATTPDPLASSHLSSWASVDKSLSSFLCLCRRFHHSEPLGGHWGMTSLGNNHYNKDIAFLSIYCSPEMAFYLLSQLTIHKINVTLSALRMKQLGLK